SLPLQYYFNSPRMECFPTQTILCSHESTDRFTTWKECQDRSIPADYRSCAANSPFVERPDGTIDCNPEPERPPCPTGSICTYKRGGSKCCDKEIEKEYHEDFQARCPEGKKAVRDPINGYGHYPLFGKECSHNFCPSDTVCREGKYLAWCCK
ncbi:hypothetical protein PMAYCL1PPCAC_21537, partial [Pristionchus mayeri]